MKQNTEKPADDRVMKFFKRDLYVQLNSPNEGEVDAAEDAWEEAVSRYEDYLEGVREDMPSYVRELAAMHLHDAEFLALTNQTRPALVAQDNFWTYPFWAASAGLAVEQAGVVRTFIYGLWDAVREYPAPEPWPFSKARKHWLCDEMVVERERHPGFLQRILFSDGTIIEIPFLTWIEVKFSLADLMASRNLNQVTA